MPLLAMAAVTLSVGTVLVTWSVMGGFLEQLVNAGRSLIGDAKITWPNTGFPYSDELIEMLEADDRVEAAAPLIETFGVINLPDDKVQGVQIQGIDPEQFLDVVGDGEGGGGFAESIWWRRIDKPVRLDKDAEDPRLDTLAPLGDSSWEELEQSGLTLTEPDGEAAAMLGVHVSGFNYRTPTGFYRPQPPIQATPDGGIRYLTNVWLPNDEITLHVMPLVAGGRGIDVTTRTIPVANEFFTGLFEIDSKVVMVRLDLLQRMLDMQESERIDPDSPRERFNPETGEIEQLEPRVIGVTPERVTTILIRGAKGVDADNELKPAVEELYAQFAARHPREVPPAGSILIRSWRELNATKIAAVEKETGLVLFVFGLVCFTTVFLVLAIFWSMVSEKTRDIGILRSMGASTAGVAWLWLRYGAIIGLVGGVLGLAMALLIVTNINEIHEWMGQNLGLVIWDPAVYLFVEIPTDLDPKKAGVVVGAAVLTCLLGAAIPAWRAGAMDPVKALRFE